MAFQVSAAGQAVLTCIANATGGAYVDVADSGPSPAACEPSGAAPEVRLSRVPEEASSGVVLPTGSASPIPPSETPKTSQITRGFDDLGPDTILLAPGW